jgi:hypothetical protein
MALAADARIAALRFQQDFAGRPMLTCCMRARIALLNEQYADVIAMLRLHSEDPARPCLAVTGATARPVAIRRQGLAGGTELFA